MDTPTLGQRFLRKAYVLLNSPEERLRQAAGRGDTAEMIELLDEGAHIDQARASKMPSPSEGTPLHHACVNGRANAIHLLLERGAQPNKTNMFKRTPLALWYLAAGKYLDEGNWQRIDLVPPDLMDAGAALVAKGGTCPHSSSDDAGPAAVLRDTLEAMAQKLLLADDTPEAPQPSARRPRL